MTKYKFFIILIILFVSIKTEAVNVNYGNTISIKSPNILIDYYGIETRTKYLCNITNYTCSKTTKTSIDNTKPKIVPKATKTEMDDKKAIGLTMSPTGNYIAYYIQAKNNNNFRIHGIKNIKTDKNYEINSNVSYWDLVAEQNKIFEFSPDGKKLIYIDDISDQMKLYFVDILKLEKEGFVGQEINTEGKEIASFIFYNSDILFYVANQKENPYNWSLYEYNFKTKENKYIDSYISYTNNLKKAGTSIIYNKLRNNGYGPVAYNLVSKKIRQFKIPGINYNYDLSNEEVLKIENYYGILMKPKIQDNKEYPLVIWLHGGPYRQTSYGYHPFRSYGIYDSILKLLPENEVFVYKLDYPGSFGFGRKYSEEIKNSVGINDVESVINSINYLKEKYNIKKVYLAGNSYGGYLSLKTIVENPKKIDGVFSINGVTDWQSLLERLKTSIFNIHFNGLPDENNKKLYEKASILNKINKLKNQKINIIQGEADKTIPAWQAILLSEKLKEKNKNVSLITYKGEDHVFYGKENINDLCVQLFKFLDKTPSKECYK